MTDEIAKLSRLTARGGVVFFGGAGVSTESGIPDFRSPDGLYARRSAYPPEEMLSRRFFFSHTKEFFDFYRSAILCCLDCKPNPAHTLCAEWERKGLVDAVVTQNIDGLHQAAGSRAVYELHGSVLKNRCTECGHRYDVEFIKNSEGIPRCIKCGGVVKPEVVLYGENLDEDTVTGAVRAISAADTLIVAGTSLTVYPAAGLINYFTGENLVVINREPVPASGALFICGKVGETLGKIK